eukprot:1195307-Prorocentrum_minimum.AAC.2
MGMRVWVYGYGYVQVHGYAGLGVRGHLHGEAGGGQRRRLRKPDRAGFSGGQTWEREHRRTQTPGGEPEHRGPAYLTHPSAIPGFRRGQTREREVARGQPGLSRVRRPPHPRSRGSCAGHAPEVGRGQPGLSRVRRPPHPRSRGSCAWHTPEVTRGQPGLSRARRPPHPRSRSPEAQGPRGGPGLPGPGPSLRDRRWPRAVPPRGWPGIPAGRGAAAAPAGRRALGTCRKARVHPGDQSDAGSMLSICETYARNITWEYSHDGPIVRRRKHGYIPMMDQSDSPAYYSPQQPGRMGAGALERRLHLLTVDGQGSARPEIRLR